MGTQSKIIQTKISREGDHYVDCKPRKQESAVRKGCLILRKNTSALFFLFYMCMQIDSCVIDKVMDRKVHQTALLLK